MKNRVSIISIVVIIILFFSTTIFAANVPVTGVQVEKNYITLEIGQTEKIIVSFSPINATNKSINWTSSNNNVATVNANGEVKGVSGGIATIKGITIDGGYTINVTINVSGESSVTSEKYLIVKKENSLKEEVRYITKISSKTNVNDFKNNITTYANMEFYNFTNEQMGNLDYIFSGVKLKLSDNSEYVLIVTGDINSNGDISVVDLSRLKIKLVGLSTLDDCQMEAADVNFDGKVSLTDLSNLKMYLVGLKENF